MGSKHIRDFREKFLERGLTPLEEIKNAKQKVSCVDGDGYKYSLDYHSCVGDKRTKSFNKWDKRNPYKPYNMRKYANSVQENCVIASTDDELRNANGGKVKFICPVCGEEYEKAWCHWIAQPNNQHYCPSCSHQKAADNKIYTYDELVDIYKEYGYKLLSTYEEYIEGGRSFGRLSCEDSDGYRYKIRLCSLYNLKTGGLKYATTNPFAIYNLQKYCNEHNVSLEIIDWQENGRRNLIVVKCECGKIFCTEPYKIVNMIQFRCGDCNKKESSYEYKTRMWLEENNIPYIQEYRFDDCKDVRSLPFDFMCETSERIVLIEVDGAQHYYEQSWFNNIPLEERKRKDKIKSDYCLKHNYILLRLPFWDFQNKDAYIKKLNKTFFGQGSDLT